MKYCLIIPLRGLNLSFKLGETFRGKTKGLKQNTILENKVKKRIKLCQNNAELTNPKHSSLAFFFIKNFKDQRLINFHH